MTGEQLRGVLGMLFQAGFGPDCLDRLSWDQVFLVAECLGTASARNADMVMAPLAAALGAKEYRPARVDTTGPRSRGDAPVGGERDAEGRARRRDSRIVAVARHHGIRVVDAATPPESSG